MNLPVSTTPEADSQIRTIDDWWREHRSTVADLFIDELAAAFVRVLSRCGMRDAAAVHL